MDASARGRLMLKLADLIDRDRDYIAKLETYNNGKPLTDAMGEMWYCAQVLRYYAGWCDKIHGSTIPVGESMNEFLHGKTTYKYEKGNYRFMKLHH